MFTFIKKPRDELIGILNSTFDGIQYFEFTRLQVKTNESTGLILGVWLLSN
jgi:hypothetical protein